MKLLIARDTSDAFSRFTVYNADEKAVYTVKGKTGTAGERIKAFDTTDKCVFKITATPSIGSITGFNVVTPNSVFAVTVKVSGGDIRLKVHGAKLFIKGNLLTRTFEITDVSAQPLAMHIPEAGKVGRFTLTVNDDSQLYPLLSVAVCADLLSFSDSAAICRA